MLTLYQLFFKTEKVQSEDFIVVIFMFQSTTVDTVNVVISGFHTNYNSYIKMSVNITVKVHRIVPAALTCVSV